eukprot:764734-Hanusia_phi.AAC.2
MGNSSSRDLETAVWKEIHYDRLHHILHLLLLLFDCSALFYHHPFFCCRSCDPVLSRPTQLVLFSPVLTCPLLFFHCTPLPSLRPLPSLPPLILSSPLLSSRTLSSPLRLSSLLSQTLYPLLPSALSALSLPPSH